MVLEQGSEPSSAVLVIRAWREPGAAEEVRARLLSDCGLGETLHAWALTAGDEAVCREVRRWLASLAARGPTDGTLDPPRGDPDGRRREGI